MKIAICLSGAARINGPAMQYTMERIVGYTNCDFYLHTWDTSGSAEDVEKYYAPQLCISKNHRIVAVQTEPEYNFSHKPWYNQQLFDYFRWGNMFKMFYGIAQCDKLREKSGKDYDLVIRHRFDLAPEKMLDLRELVDAAQTSVITSDEYTKTTWKDTPVYGEQGEVIGPMCNDTFAITTPKNMSRYSKAFYFIDEYSLLGHPIHPETITYYNLKKYGIDIHMMGQYTIRYNR
jgi:hypothetical protein